jgi:hypothetical protein
MNSEINKGAWAEEIPNPDGPRADLPLIILPSGEMSITEAAEKLFKHMAQSKRYFVRGGKIMKVVLREDGSLALEVLEAEAARSDFEKFGRLAVYRVGANGEKVLKPTVCPTETAKALLASEEALTLLPKVNGLINCPIIFEQEGTLHVANPGYDAQSQLLITGGKTPPGVDLDTAVQKLLELVAEFDFCSEGDKSRAIASLFTPAMKLGGFIKSCVPADVAEADQSQSGKTYRQRVVATIYNEAVSLVTNRQGGVGSVDESLSQAVVAGRPFIQLDNFRGRVDSQHLEAFLTAGGSFPCRIPHKGEIRVQSDNFFVFLTSNGVDTTRDFANRSSVIRIRKKPAGFKFRKYEEGDLLAHVKANQAFYLGCIFTVIRAWHRAGKPKTDETRHDFREWVQILDWIVQNIFKLKPIMDGHQQAQEHISNPDVVFLRAVALAVEKAEQFGRPLTASDILAICEAADISIPGQRRADADPDRLVLVIGRSMGRLFRDSLVRQIDGYQIERQETDVRRNDGQGYSTQKSYIFGRVSDDTKGDQSRKETSHPSFCPPPMFPFVSHEPGITNVSFQRPPHLQETFVGPSDIKP